MFTSMSEIAPSSANNNPSEVSFDGKKSPSPKLNLPSTMSQNLHSPTKEVELPEYRLKLLKLMVEVRLQEMGYSRVDISSFAEREVRKINISEVDLSQFSQIALDIVSQFLDHHSLDFRGVGRRSMREYSRRSFSEEHHESAPRLRIEMREVMRQPQQEVLGLPRQPFRQILCSICCLLSSHFRQQKCHHTFCEDCIRSYVLQNITSGNYIINCPEYNCHQILTKGTIQSLIDARQYKRFLYFQDKNEKELNPNNKFCSRPDCEEVLFKHQDHLHCPKCNTNYCQICLQQFHEGTKCDVALKTSLEHTYNAFKIKKCPNCKSPIEKSEGCNHMNCKKCKHEFCWICLKPYSTFHYKYYNCFGCPGMQFEEQDEILCERTKQVCLYLFLPLILAILLSCYLASIPLYMIGCFVYKPLEWINRAHTLPQGSFVQCIFFWLPQCLQVILLWVIFQPRAILFSVFVAPMKITAIFCGEVSRAFQ